MAKYWCLLQLFLGQNILDRSANHKISRPATDGSQVYFTNLNPFDFEHVHAHTCINTKPSRHPHHVLTLFHLCRRKQQRSGSAVGIRESHLHQALAQLIIRGKRCCPWIQCTTNSGDVYFAALTVHADKVTPLHAACCCAHDGKTKKADMEKEKHRTQRNVCIEPRGQKELVRGRQEYK